MIEEYAEALAARDEQRVLGVFAPTAVENGRRGSDIGANYRRTFRQYAAIDYRVPDMQVTRRGPRVTIRGPFEVRSVDTAGQQILRTGTAEWQIERQGDRSQIVAFTYHYDRPAVVQAQPAPTHRRARPHRRPPPEEDEDLSE